jgi:hypothetical protein
VTDRERRSLAGPDRRRLRVAREAVAQVQDMVGWVFGQRLDLDRLSDGEITRLCELVTQSAIPFGHDRGALSEGEQRDLEALVAKGAGLSGDHFERQRKEDAMAQKAEQEAARKRRMPFSRHETTDVFLTFYRELMEENLWADDAAILTLILAQFAAGTPFTSTSRFEGTGDDLTLVIDANMGMLGHVDGQGALDNWYQRILFLAESEEGWLALERRGPTWRIRLGPRLKGALDTAKVAA